MTSLPCVFYVLLFIAPLVFATELSSLPIRSTKIGDNVKCAGTLLTYGKRESLEACWDRCLNEERCNYLVWWEVKKYCETYATCTSTVSIDESSILLQKISECEVELGSDRQGRYVHEITRQFEENAVRSQNPNQNLWCQCIGQLIMVCGIFVKKGSKDEGIVRSRIDKSDLLALRPFFIMPTMSTEFNRIAFDPSAGLGNDRVTAEIELMHPNSCVLLSSCMQGSNGPICPITKRVIQSGDPIYTLNEDSTTMENMRPKSVLCISAAGLRALSYANDNEEGFVDPFKRRNQEKLHITKDYSLYFAFSKEMITDGFCGRELAEFKESPSEKTSPSRSQDQSGEGLSRGLDALQISGLTPRSASSSQIASSFRQRGEPSVLKLPSTPMGSETSSASGVRSEFAPNRPAFVPPAVESLSPSRPFEAPPVGTKCYSVLHPTKSIPPGTTGVITKHLEQQRLIEVQTSQGEVLTIPREYIMTKEDLIDLVGADTITLKAESKSIDKKNPIFPKTGSEWIIRDFQSRPELTGMRATVEEVNKPKQRIKVRIEEGDFKGTSVKVKLIHLLSVEDFENALEKFAKETTEHYTKQENLQTYERQMQEKHTSISTSPKVPLHFILFAFFTTLFTSFIIFSSFTCTSSGENVYIKFHQDEFI